MEAGRPGEASQRSRQEMLGAWARMVRVRMVRRPGVGVCFDGQYLGLLLKWGWSLSASSYGSSEVWISSHMLSI